ncbi:MAG: hypothetical protein UV68_C0027G0003 [Candidatus Collierbacteria bacterium GW2011_GWC2_43_12]|uniref:Uncharacterized protein n=1 Tax=Candidatus Collierbacteria bacterium GW2011_GWC2_43_12 TaxID=1618390 RepID=A0A0G1D5E8_9BACT|nr:MAG: hypothetical protein UV68_C0027G0003 [Candidatus Collierbacteria bacterium GW2011_GWC2_43_12]
MDEVSFSGDSDWSGCACVRRSEDYPFSWAIKHSIHFGDDSSWELGDAAESANQLPARKTRALGIGLFLAAGCAQDSLHHSVLVY